MKTAKDDNTKSRKKNMTTSTQKEEAWASSDALIDWMFDGSTIRCPFPAVWDNTKQCDQLPHMVGTVFGNIPPHPAASGRDLTIQFTCESGHEWQLRWTDDSGALLLSIVETDLFYRCEECHELHLKQPPHE
jgi:hypothetical protein